MAPDTEDELDTIPDAKLLAMPGELIPAGRLTAFFTRRAELLHRWRKRDRSCLHPDT